VGWPRDMTAAALVCGSCGTELPPNSRFCNKCGAAVATATTPAEYKQVTVLFADVVHSMDIAAAVGAERLREIMTELVNRAIAVVQHFGGTVDKFTGDGIMAVFGAPVALEDHAFRACLAALGIQAEAGQLRLEVRRGDGVDLRVRIGLNSGQVIVGEIGSGGLGYTAIGEQVGMAQRMESVAPPGGVMLSESTARLVERAVLLGEPGLVHVKGVAAPTCARRLLAVGDHQPSRRSEARLVGRTWELNTISGILDEVINGSGYVITLEGPPGIGKSRLVRETTAIATRRGVRVLTTYCESHASDIPFHVVARLLRAGMEIDELDAGAARARVRELSAGADAEDLLLLDDLLGIRDTTMPLREIAPEARRRRLTALIIGASLARKEPAVYVLEDVHWIDEVSESMLADFFSVTPQTTSLILITHRPEYRGLLTRVPGAQNLALRPLNDAQASALTAELLGADPSLGELTTHVATRASGNPYFAEEMVRDLAERGVLHGEPGAYQLRRDVADVEVPATLQATIGARIDRLDPTAKHTLNAAAVIGARFDIEQLSALVDGADVGALIGAELVDQVRFSAQPEYAFHHPLIRTVAYESQLKSDRAQLHRRVAAAIEARGSADENAALIAEHFEAAGDLNAAFQWHMRAATWSRFRDVVATQTSWVRARQVADRLPDESPNRLQMRIAPRTMIAGYSWRVSGRGADTGFDELHDLCTAAADQRSLATGLLGPLMNALLNGRRREASRFGDEQVRLLESIGDPTLTVGLLLTVMATKLETGEAAELLRLARRAIDLAAGDSTKGNLIGMTPTPLATVFAYRGAARWCLGMAGWKDDIDRALGEVARSPEANTLSGVVLLTYGNGVSNGILRADSTALRRTAEALAFAGQSGDDLALDSARTARGIVLAHQDGAEREGGFELLAKVRERVLNDRFALTPLAMANAEFAREKARVGDLDGAVALARAVVDELFDHGPSIWSAVSTAVLVEALLCRGGEGDPGQARAATQRLAAVPTDPGFVLNDIWLLRLRALLARAQGDAEAYKQLRDRYRDMARSLGFDGHIAWAEAMP
jgi:adenylate cyclase